MSSVDILTEVATRVLEDCAFLFLDVAETTECDTSNALASSIAVMTDRLHVLKLVASRPLLIEAAANMLGTESDDPEASSSAEQAISELLNVVAGSLVATLYGTAGEFALGIPARADPKLVPDDAVVVTFHADGGDFLRLELR